MTDDQDYESMPVMRHLLNYPEGQWVNFVNAYSNTSICAPARSIMLTGQYSRHNGVYDNKWGSKLDDTNTLPIWLGEAGYRTGVVGKYVHFHTNKNLIGWDLYSMTNKSVDGHTQDAINFINQDDSPFFLWVAHRAPHRVAKPPGRYANVDAYMPPITANYNEADLSDKPSHMRKLPKLGGAQLAAIQAERLNAQRETLAIDDGVLAIVETLRDTGKLDNTMIIFVSDNGFAFAAHRLYKKMCVYEECSHVPLLIRYPGAGESREEDAFVSIVDLPATIAEYAGITPGLPQDGHSLIPLLQSPDAPWDHAVLLEKMAGTNAFDAIRTDGWLYVEYTKTNERELYDMEADPYQIQNIANQPAYAEIQAQLAARLDLLLDPPPPTPTPTMTSTPTATATAPNTATPTPSDTATPGSSPTPSDTPTPTDTATPTETPTETATPTITSTPTDTPTPTLTPTPDTRPHLVYLSGAANVKVGGHVFADEDIFIYNLTADSWHLYFDGSAVGLADTDVDAFALLGDGSLLLSFDAPFHVPGLGPVDDYDIVRFVPDALGTATSGVFEWYVDGSDVDLTADSEDIDAIGVLPDGDLIISTKGTASVGLFKVEQNDLTRLTLTQTGAETAGTWRPYFDGSDVGLTTAAEDINAVYLGENGRLYLSTMGNFNATTIKGKRDDIFVCNLLQEGTNTVCAFDAAYAWQAKVAGISFNLDGVSFGRDLP